MIADTLPSLDEMKQSLGSPSSSRWGSLRWVAGGLVLGTTLLALLIFTLKSKPRQVSYQSASITRQDLRVTVRSTGSLQAVTNVEVGAELSGRVVKVLVDVNDEVRKGQVLAEIDPEQFSSGLEQARAQLVAAEAAIRQAEATAWESATDPGPEPPVAGGRHPLPRPSSIHPSAPSSGLTLPFAPPRRTARVAKATQDMALSKLRKTTIRAPIDGVVLARLVEPGQTVTAGFATPVTLQAGPGHAEDAPQRGHRRGGCEPHPARSARDLRRGGLPGAEPSLPRWSPCRWIPRSPRMS